MLHFTFWTWIIPKACLYTGLKISVSLFGISQMGADNAKGDRYIACAPPPPKKSIRGLDLKVTNSTKLIC